MQASRDRREPRRWLAFCVPPFLLIVLVLVGRRVAVSEASAAPSSTATSTDVVVDASPEAVPNDASSDSAPEIARAIETLADGAVIVDLNLANEDELRKLPGIGPGRARKIVELRTKLGRLKSVDDLARIKGFGRALVKRIRPLVRTS